MLDGRGNVVFFLGGQINCSTTVHNSSDILRILASSNDDEVDTAEVKDNAITSRLLSAFKGSKKSSKPPRQPGMENTLLDRLERMNLQTQMDEFYTAYSKVRICRAY